MIPPALITDEGPGEGVRRHFPRFSLKKEENP